MSALIAWIMVGLLITGFFPAWLIVYVNLILKFLPKKGIFSNFHTIAMMCGAVMWIGFLLFLLI